MIHCPGCYQKKSYGRTIVHLCDNEIAFYGMFLNSGIHEDQWNYHQNAHNTTIKDKGFIKSLILFEKNFVTTLYE
ncbi:MAG: hypothetical protein ACFFEY_14895 [Candidatus Thorarchaeota archaeon]